ncbi:glycosyl transferase [Thiocystis minor]|uniref:TIGR04283 family arsenosugar biosynthesis glycosyltransferase n=1 Tax=Thiocystis minor TaxID=61597 RepID=UPI0019119613|nr:TIGR04283 family arsenosugar biosynthesis glycosyltransferase [Thiocystis minor]MBK5966561.1 glycosyl transferase [Thiocystis minor]
MRLSIVIPTLNEADHIGALLTDLAPLRATGHEVILVDGGSTDATWSLAASGVDRVLESPHGRAVQMNAGARVASGEFLWFLHADTRVPPGAPELLLATCKAGARWGRFDVRLSVRHPLLRLVERAMNLRSRLTGIATGDQGIFVTRDTFAQIGGFPDLPLMEDIALSKRLRRIARPACLRPPLLTSSRRWESRGVVCTILLMWQLRLAYALGADLARLARRYDN